MMVRTRRLRLIEKLQQLTPDGTLEPPPTVSVLSSALSYADGYRAGFAAAQAAAIEVVKADRVPTMTLAQREGVAALRPWVEQVLDAVGHPEALVTDESWVSDFLPGAFVDPDATPEERHAARETCVAATAAVAARLGVPIGERDTLVDVALRLRGKASPPSEAS